MREMIDAGARVIVAALAGAGLVALAALISDLLPPNGAPDALGGWPLLATLAALLCGVCALGMSAGMSVGLGARSHGATQAPLVALLLASPLAWGVCLSAAVSSANWAHALAGAPLLARAVAPLAAAGATVVAWLLLFAALAGAVAGMRRAASATRRALTPLWLTPLWGAGVGVVYGLLAASIYTPRPSGVHFYGLDAGRWDGLRAGLSLGVGAGLMLGLTLALALRMALVVRPVPTERSSRRMRHVAQRLEA